MVVKMPQVKVAKTSLTYGTLLSGALRIMYLVLAFIFARASAIALMELDFLQLIMCTLTITYAFKYHSRLTDGHLFGAFFNALDAEATGIYNAHNGIRANGLDADSGWLIPYLLGKSGLRYWWCLSGLLNKCPEYAVVDTGSQCNIMSAEYAESHRLHVAGPRQSFRLANSTLATSEGYVKADWIFEGENMEVYRLKFHVIKDLRMNLIIGSEFLKEIETLSRNFNRVRRKLLSKACFTFPVAFSNILAQHAISYTSFLPNVSLCRPYLTVAPERTSWTQIGQG